MVPSLYTGHGQDHGQTWGTSAKYDRSAAEGLLEGQNDRTRVFLFMDQIWLRREILKAWGPRLV